MKIYSVFDPEFSKYGRVLRGNFDRILALLKETELPEEGTVYVPSDPKLEEKEIVEFFSGEVYGEMPVQIGYCNGHNQKLNCLEYHKGNEVNLSNDSFILLLGSYFDLVDGKLDTSKVMAFQVPAKVAVEVYGTSLHYAPCGVGGEGFRCLIALPKGTNYPLAGRHEDPALWASNKWLLAHPDSDEAKQGAYVGLTGENLVVE